MEGGKISSWQKGFTAGYEAREQKAQIEKQKLITEIDQTQVICNELDARNKLLEEETADYHQLQASYALRGVKIKQLSEFVQNGPEEVQELKQEIDMLKIEIEEYKDSELLNERDKIEAEEAHARELHKLVEATAQEKQEIRDTAKQEIAALHVYYTEKLRRRDAKIQKVIESHDQLFGIIAQRPQKRAKPEDEEEDRILTQVNLAGAFDEAAVQDISSP